MELRSNELEGDWSEVEFYSDDETGKHLSSSGQMMSTYPRAMDRQNQRRNHRHGSSRNGIHLEDPQASSSRRGSQKQLDKIGHANNQWMTQTNPNRVDFSSNGPCIQNYDPVEYIMDKIDSEINVEPVKAKPKSKLNRRERARLKEEGVLFDAGDEKSKEPRNYSRSSSRRMDSRLSYADRDRNDTGFREDNFYRDNRLDYERDFARNKGTHIIGQADTYSESDGSGLTTSENTTSLSEDEDILKDHKTVPRDLDSDTAVVVNHNYKHIMKKKHFLKQPALVKSSKPSHGKKRKKKVAKPSTKQVFTKRHGQMYSKMPQRGQFPSDDLESVRTEDFENQFNSMVVKQVANVPVNNFDQMLIESDLDTVTSQMVREKFWSPSKHLRNTGSDITEASSESEYQQEQHLPSHRKKTIPLRSSSFNDRLYSKQTNPNVNPKRLSTRRTDINGNQSRTENTEKHSINADGKSLGDFESEQHLSRKPPHDVLRGRQRSRSEEVDARQERFKQNGLSRFDEPDEGRQRLPHGGRSTHGSGGSFNNSLLDTPLNSSIITQQASSGGIIHQLSLELNRLHASIAKAETIKQNRIMEVQQVEETLQTCQSELSQIEKLLKKARSDSEDQRSEFMLIEFKKETAQKEIRSLREEIDRRKSQLGSLGDMAVKERQALKTATLAQEQVDTLHNEAEQLQLRLKTLESVERERKELEKQLGTTKESLFAEQRRSREKIESFREDLEHHQTQLEEAIKEKDAMQKKVFQFETKVRQIDREKNAIIEEKTEEMKKLQQKLAERLSDVRTNNSKEMTDLKVQLKDAKNKASEAANMKQEIEEKEENIREKFLLVRSELSTVSIQLENERQKYEKNLKEICEQKDEELRVVRESLEKNKEEALTEVIAQKESLINQTQQQQLHQLQELQQQLAKKEVEAKILKERLKEQDNSMKYLNDSIRQEVTETLQSSHEEQRVQIEKEMAEKYKEQLSALQERTNKELLTMEEQMKSERQGTLQLQTVVNNIKQELEQARHQNQTVYNEKLTALQQAKEDSEKERNKQIEQIRQRLQNEYKSELDRLSSAVSCQATDIERLKADNNNLSERCRTLADEAGKLEQLVVQEANDECKKMADFTGLPARITTAQGSSMTWSSGQSSYNPTIRSAIPIAVSNMKLSGDELRKVVLSLRKELNNQKIKTSHIEQDKPPEYFGSTVGSLQSRPKVTSHHTGGNFIHTSQAESLESLRMRLLQEKQQSMDSLKNRLIKEHVHEVERLHKNFGEDRKLAKSLKEKDNELKEIVKNMGSWKEQTADKLAIKFQKEMDREIERQEPIEDNRRHIREFERKERAWDREKAAQQRKIDNLDSDLERQKLMTHTFSNGYRSPMKGVHDELINTTPLPSNKASFADDNNVERLHNLQHKMTMLQRENDNFKPSNTPLKTSTSGYDLLNGSSVGGGYSYNDTISAKDMNDGLQTGNSSKYLEERLGIAERRARINEQRADQNEQILNQKIQEMNNLHGTLSQQSKELMQVERAYSNLHTTLASTPPKSPSRSDSRVGFRNGSIHGSRPNSRPTSRPSSRNSLSVPR